MNSKKDFFYSWVFFPFLALSILFFPNAQLQKGLRPSFILWNVGQGQWATYVDSFFCIHFDIGGEFMPWNDVLRECRYKRNFLFLSHGDWDHIRFAKRAKKQLLHFCIHSRPRESLSSKKRAYLKNLSLCNLKEKTFLNHFVEEVSFDTSLQGDFFKIRKNRKSGSRKVRKNRKIRLKSQSRRRFKKSRFEKSRFKNGEVKKLKRNFKKKKRRYPRRRLKANDLSRVFVLKGQILLPGDSTKRAEKVWTQNMKASKRNRIRWLIAPHHGSYTSSSKELLKALPHLEFVLISARKKVYGHPHKKVLKRFKERNLSVLKTEAWGHIIFQM